jgi:hypothetical protein
VTGADTWRAKNQQSLWWRDLVALSYAVHNQFEWFAEEVKILLGDGSRLNFGAIIGWDQIALLNAGTSAPVHAVSR